MRLTGCIVFEVSLLCLLAELTGDRILIVLLVNTLPALFRVSIYAKVTLIHTNYQVVFTSEESDKQLGDPIALFGELLISCVLHQPHMIGVLQAQVLVKDPAHMVPGYSFQLRVLFVDDFHCFLNAKAEWSMFFHEFGNSFHQFFVSLLLFLTN
jgi:hypothetical protein